MDAADNARCAHGKPFFRKKQGNRDNVLFLGSKGKMADRIAFSFTGDRDELRVFDPVGAYCGHRDAGTKELHAQRSGVAQQECFGRCIHVQPLKRLKGSS